MNKLLYFVAGAIVGAGTSYFVLKKKYESDLNRELSELANRELDEERNKKQNKINSNDISFKVDQNKDYSEYDTATKDIPEDITVTDYDPELDVEEDSELIDENEYEDDFYDDNDELYEKGEIFYFFKNDLFTDDEENPITDLEKIFNDKETIDKVKDIIRADDYDGSCYIRCHRLKMDYMVICDFRNYKDVVGNIDDIRFD